MKDVLHLSQYTGNNFRVVQCTLLSKLISLDLLYRLVDRGNVSWGRCNNGVHVILHKYGKGGRTGGRTSLRQLEFHYKFFVSMLV